MERSDYFLIGTEAKIDSLWYSTDMLYSALWNDSEKIVEDLQVRYGRGIPSLYSLVSNRRGGLE